MGFVELKNKQEEQKQKKQKSGIGEYLTNPALIAIIFVISLALIAKIIER